jgi:hypothetical protein
MRAARHMFPVFSPLGLRVPTTPGTRGARIHIGFAFDFELCSRVPSSFEGIGKAPTKFAGAVGARGAYIFARIDVLASHRMYSMKAKGRTAHRSQCVANIPRCSRAFEHTGRIDRAKTLAPCMEFGSEWFGWMDCRQVSRYS